MTTMLWPDEIGEPELLPLSEVDTLLAGAFAPPLTGMSNSTSFGSPVPPEPKGSSPPSRSGTSTTSYDEDWSNWLTERDRRLLDSLTGRALTTRAQADDESACALTP
ncbi:hypothetical protein [Saccharopolyspora spinosa]|nr:hypothetical protein [Saccharopolyspora spinosa]